MKQTRLIMGMPVTVEVTDKRFAKQVIEDVFTYFRYIDRKFSTYKKDSEISKINRGEISKKKFSSDMKTVLDLCVKTKKETNGYFDIERGEKRDPSGIVKGWAIYKASGILRKSNITNFYINAGGDIQVSGKNKHGEHWKVGIRDPFDHQKIVKMLELCSNGVATSGTYERGQHIHDPYDKNREITDILSITVVGPNVYEADRFATAAFAMGRKGIEFIESIPSLEGYMIDKDGIATMTGGFEKYVSKN